MLMETSKTCTSTNDNNKMEAPSNAISIQSQSQSPSTSSSFISSSPSPSTTANVTTNDNSTLNVPSSINTYMNRNNNFSFLMSNNYAAAMINKSLMQHQQHPNTNNLNLFDYSNSTGNGIIYDQFFNSTVDGKNLMKNQTNSNSTTMFAPTVSQPSDMQHSYYANQNNFLYLQQQPAPNNYPTPNQQILNKIVQQPQLRNYGNTNKMKNSNASNLLINKTAPNNANNKNAKISGSSSSSKSFYGKNLWNNKLNSTSSSVQQPSSSSQLPVPVINNDLFSSINHQHQSSNNWLPPNAKSATFSMDENKTSTANNTNNPSTNNNQNTNANTANNNQNSAGNNNANGILNNFGCLMESNATSSSNRLLHNCASSRQQKYTPNMINMIGLNGIAEPVQQMSQNVIDGSSMMFLNTNSTDAYNCLSQNDHLASSSSWMPWDQHSSCTSTSSSCTETITTNHSNHNDSTLNNLISSSNVSRNIFNVWSGTSTGTSADLINDSLLSLDNKSTDSRSSVMNNTNHLNNSLWSSHWTSNSMSKTTDILSTNDTCSSRPMVSDISSTANNLDRVKQFKLLMDFYHENLQVLKLFFLIIKSLFFFISVFYQRRFTYDQVDT